LEILLLLAYASFFIFLIYKLPFFKADGISKRSLSLVFILKISFGLLLWLIYTYYYTNRATADIYKYFDDSQVLFDALKTQPAHYFKMLFGIGNDTPEFDTYYYRMNHWARSNSLGTYNDGHTVIRFNAFVRLFSFGYYTVHTVFICFISLIGFTAIYKAFVPFLANKKRALFIAVFLLPSVLFWGSGVLKEGLLFFTLGLFIYFFQQSFSWKTGFICIAAAVLMAVSKFYVWLALIPGLLFLLVIRLTGKKKIALKLASVLLLVTFLGTSIDRFTGIQNPLVTLTQKQIEFKALAAGNNSDANLKNIPAAGSRIDIPDLQPNLFSFIKNAPVALFTVLFRPFPWKARSPIIAMASLENVFILLIILTCVLHPLPLKQIKWEYVLFCLSFVLIQFLIIGETTPVLGAIARYKVPALPFLLIAFLLILDKVKLLTRFPFLEKLLPANRHQV
jgi:hypothetical protein